MEIKQLTADLSVSGQITAADVQSIADQGFRTLICNRPDKEGDDQPDFDDIASAAKAAGMEARYLPVVSGKVLEEDAVKFGKLLDEVPGPVLAFCRSGARSSTLWSMANGDA